VSDIPSLRTERLRLRAFSAEDRAAFAELNADPEVMRHFPSTLAAAESDALADRIDLHWLRHDFGLWAVERSQEGDFIGFVGLAVPAFSAPFTPCVEIGWRLSRKAWGCGYATEGARAALRFGFVDRGLEEVVSFTVTGNTRSRRVMERLGMRHEPAEVFDHPLLPPGHPLRGHVLYRLRRPEWLPWDPAAGCR
jgi:RimJ/RimL family protein N-acetyltransferase